MRKIMGALEHEGAKTWTLHQVTLLDEMKKCRRPRTGKPEKKFAQ